MEEIAQALHLTFAETKAKV